MTVYLCATCLCVRLESALNRRNPFSHCLLTSSPPSHGPSELDNETMNGCAGGGAVQLGDIHLKVGFTNGML